MRLGLCTKQENGCVVSGAVYYIREITSVVPGYFVLREVVELVKVVAGLGQVVLQDFLLHE